ncbi:SusC/RagA family TonB-linked outer membrane protein [Hanamia caeni]|uniref:SusC/RagA family TonB-linked outer membrane protein n=2 Tax=Hanamia caeni TaxID=2294116 RepID=A0A3M9N6T3_9BACT|nr:SusC/RagA family TonB-linked outer membrane protein [Hanamia caeni]
MVVFVALVSAPMSLLAQNLSVQGTVTSDDNPGGILGVTVAVSGTANATSTDKSGHYVLRNLKPTDSLVFSFVGFKDQTEAIKGRRQVNIKLERNVSSLDQVVVIGYGTAKKKDLTGAISSVNVAKLQNENPTSVQDAMRANVPGLSVGVTSGAKPGGSLQIRGTNSLNAGTSPLIVLDGVIYYGALSDINPQDIATVDVLKDASAAAVYGAKSASGVILINTKKGKPGKPTINFNSNLAIATMEINQPVYQGQDFVNWRVDVQKSIHGFNEKPYQFDDPRTLPSNISIDDWLAYDASSGDPVSVWLTRLNFQPVEQKNYLAGHAINWYDMMFQNALQQNYTLSVSGGTDKFSYYWSGGYLNNKGIVVGDKYTTIQSRLKIDAEITKFLTVGVNTQFADRDESGVPVNWGLIVQNSPYGSFYNDDSTDYRYSPQDDPGAGARNPFIKTKYTNRLKKYYTLNSIIYGKVSLPFGIKYTVNFSPEFEFYNYFNGNGVKDPDFTKIGGRGERENHQIYQWQIDNILSWNKTFNNDHHIDVTLLANAEKYNYWQNDMVGTGFDPSDVLSYHNMGAALTQTISSDDEYSTGAAYMARVFYSYKDRYMLTLSARQDGYSAFGQKYPWAQFPAAAFGWVFTKESFFNAPWFNYGKLRLSYGINGNRDIGRYSALSNLATGKYLVVNPDGTTSVVSQLYVTQMANPDLKWEQTSAYNIGLDFSLLRNVLSGSIDVYKGKTTNLLVNRSLPDVVGFANVQSNLGEVDNKGLEISLNSNNINRQNFRWSTSFNFSLNRNKIAHLYGNMVDVTDADGHVIGKEEASDIPNGWFIGHPIDAIWDLKVLGVYQTSEADLANTYGQKPGDFKVEDVNGDGKYTNEDRMFLGFSKPRYNWTLRNNFTFLRNFDFSFLIYSSWGFMSSFNQAKNKGGFPDRTDGYVYPYWTPDHATTDFSRIFSSDGSASYSVYRKRNFIRLDNVALAYTLPKNLVERAKIEDLKFYISVKNAAVYAPDWEYWDPEWDSSGPGPTPRTFTFGFNLTL